MEIDKARRCSRPEARVLLASLDPDVSIANLLGIGRPEDLRYWAARGGLDRRNLLPCRSRGPRGISPPGK